MIYRQFKEINLSGLGLGMMRLPVIDGDDARVDFAATEEMIDYAMKNGINYYDTAWGYHNGESEIAVGKILSKYERNSFYLADKFPGYDNSNMPKVKEIFEKQLEKCRTPYFDFYLIHNVYEGNVDDYCNPEFKILEYLLKQKKEGKIKHFGFSSHGDVQCIKKFLSVYGEHMEFCQLQLNFMDWHFQKCEDKVKLCKEYGLPVWVMEPLRGGKLCKLSDDMTEKLKLLRPEETVPAWAFRFHQSLPEVKVVLSGMSNMQQLKDNIETWKEDKPLSQEEFDRLISLIDEEVKKISIPCTACHYCTSHCPMELPIPELIAAYNEHKSNPAFLAPMFIGSLPNDKRPASCISCRSCEAVCPQQIKISEVMKELSEMVGM